MPQPHSGFLQSVGRFRKLGAANLQKNKLRLYCVTFGYANENFQVSPWLDNNDLAASTQICLASGAIASLAKAPAVVASRDAAH
jgi:hypothetical protein